MSVACWLIVLLEYCLTDVMGLDALVLDSMEMVACDNSHLCDDGVNLRIVFNASASKVSPGLGSFIGTISSGNQWNDSFGEWELTQSIEIDIDYDAFSEYKLLDKGTIPIWLERVCYIIKEGAPGVACEDIKDFPILPCNVWIEGSQENDNVTMYLVERSRFNVFAVSEAVNTWNAHVSIASLDLNVTWNANAAKNTLFDPYGTVSIDADAVVDTTCNKSFQDPYYVVFDRKKYYFIFKKYFTGKLNGLNFTEQTWWEDHTCNWTFLGRHTIVPYLGEKEETYDALYGSNNEDHFGGMCNNQLYFWMKEAQEGGVYFHDFIPAGCIDVSQYGSEDMDEFRASSLYNVDFQIQLDLGKSFYESLFSDAPSQSPSKRPTTKPPTTKPPTSLSPSQSPTSNPIVPPTSAPSKAPTSWLSNPWQYYETPGKLQIDSTNVIDVSRSTVSEKIIESLASSLNIDPLYVRLDFAEYMTSARRRMLQSNDEILILTFTIFATTEDEKIIFAANLGDASIQSNIKDALNDKFSGISSISVGNVMNECGPGTQYTTVAGQRRCESICAVNHYYDNSSSSCKEQVEYIPITIIEKNYIARMLYFGIGIITGIGTLCLGYGIYRYCSKNELESEESEGEDKSKRRRSKKRVKAIAHDADSDLTESESYFTD